jgi:hypothetical protein
MVVVKTRRVIPIERARRESKREGGESSIYRRDKT